jgi:hypothetical protein
MLNRRTALAGLIGLVSSGFLKNKSEARVVPISEEGGKSIFHLSEEEMERLKELKEEDFGISTIRGNVMVMPKEEWIGKWPGK